MTVTTSFRGHCPLVSPCGDTFFTIPKALIDQLTVGRNKYTVLRVCTYQNLPYKRKNFITEDHITEILEEIDHISELSAPGK